MLTAIWIFAPLLALFLRHESRLGRAAPAALVTGAALFATAALTYRTAFTRTADQAFRDTYYIISDSHYLALLSAVYAAVALPLWAIHRWPAGSRWSPRLFLAFHAAVILILLPSEALTLVGMPRRDVLDAQVFYWLNLAASAGAMLAALSLMAIILLGLAAAWRLIRRRGQS